MNVKESDARKMLTAVGFNADSMKNVAKVQKKVSGLVPVKGTLKEPESKEDADLRDVVLAALEAGEEVIVVSDDGVSAEQNGNVGTVEKRSRKKAGTASAESNGHVEADAFGCRLGTNRAKANVVLFKANGTPLKMSEIIAKGALTSSVSTHMIAMKKGGFAKNDGEGYVLTAKGLAKMSKK